MPKIPLFDANNIPHNETMLFVLKNNTYGNIYKFYKAPNNYYYFHLSENLIKLHLDLNWYLID